MSREEVNAETDVPPSVEGTVCKNLPTLVVESVNFYKYFKDLEEIGLVAASRKIGRATLYKINLESPLIKMLIEYERQLSLQIAEQESAKMQKPFPLSINK